MVVINHDSGQPYYAQLVAGLKREIARGILQTDDQLPSVREMAKAHLLNPNTVSKAYKQLEAQQVIRTVPGKGTYVNAIDPAVARSELQQKLQQLVLQASQAGITIADLITWLTKMEGQSL
ncbi:GntR family transcriptional regulator [Lactiplantibacillus sp. WILCCON 0030]|uniref:GntR family transcriptional regulator n=1 Tax=Lactiplantibacillus brownii TaxID=3069269 RepID=A0ABU1A776_9LACO|nr:GntR family transcriptional regulator [Lactiplantibacillus brownii]MDQ7936307.1 GntR family transcriptional regulator [Lactiplantibacillus brownii]